MQTHTFKLFSYQSRKGSDSHTITPFTSRPFKITYPGQESASSATNPFPRRPHEVWMGEPPIARKPASTADFDTATLSEARNTELDLNRVNFYTPRQTALPAANWQSTGTPSWLQRKKPTKTKSSDKVPKTVTLKLSWLRKLGGSVNAKVVIKKATKKTAKNLTDVAGKDAVDVQVPFHPKISIKVIPTDPPPNDRYQSTTKVVTLKAGTSSMAIVVKLPVNRWNPKNVDQVWKDKGIDAAKANQVKSFQLLGHSVRLNTAVESRIKITNEAFEKLDKKIQKEIKDSILIIGGYAKRTTSEGTFSDHSVGCAIDINYSMPTKQNFHFKPSKKKVNQDKALLNFVQTVVRQDPAFSSFDIMKAKGEKQLEASQRFNELFPAYLLSLLEVETPAVDKNKPTDKPKKTFDSVTEADLDQAIKVAKKGTTLDHLILIRKEWKSLNAWIKGSKPEGTTNKNKKLVGMIPLNKALLKLMLAAGWNWGGDWSTAKDYMHFQDDDAFKAIQLRKPKKSKKPKK